MLSTKSFFVRFLREHELKIDVVNYTNFTLSLQSVYSLSMFPTKLFTDFF